MHRDGHNGYTNYETWLVCLWLDNDEPLYREARAKVAEVIEQDDDADADEIDRDAQLSQAAEVLKEWITDEEMPELDAGIASDLLNAALSEVDWFEVAKTRLDD